MTYTDEELLSQYLDGELGAVDASQLEQRLAAEPQLQASYQSMRKTNETLKSTFNSTRARAVPARIISTVQQSGSSPSKTSGNVVPFPGRQRKASWGFAIAASIMAASGLLLVQGTGQQLAGPSPAADTLLAQALEITPSRGEEWDVLEDGREVRPVLTYARVGGGWCREYLLADQTGQSRGIACKRDGGTWITEAVDTMAQQSVSSDEYRTAGAGDSDKIATFTGNNATGIALSAEQEQALIAARWQR